MIEQELLNYGVLGLWTVTLLFEKYNLMKKFKTVISNNTQELALLREAIGGNKIGRRVNR